VVFLKFFFFFSSRRRHTRSLRDWSSDVCSSDLPSVAQCLGGNILRVVAKNSRTSLNTSSFLPHARRQGGNESRKIRPYFFSRIRSEERRVGKSLCIGGVR